MRRRANYERELQDIFDKLVVMCRIIENGIEKCVGAFMQRDFDLAQEVYEDSQEVSKLERAIEQACLRLLVMEQPLASDFREVSTALKLITELERIGDNAWDIAELTMQFKSEQYMEKMEQMPQMATIVIQMVKDSVQAYINRDLDLARSINTTDDKLDELYTKTTDDLINQIKNKPNKTRQIVRLLMIAKYFERIGDHAVSVSEWVEYSITGSHPKNRQL